jgi:hypothetical protein
MSEIMTMANVALYQLLMALTLHKLTKERVKCFETRSSKSMSTKSLYPSNRLFRRPTVLAKLKYRVQSILYSKGENNCRAYNFFKIKDNYWEIIQLYKI